LASRLSDLIALHGDLEIVFDCDAILTELASVELFSGPFPDLPVFIIYPPPPRSESSL
jgi:hypothetical protein